MTGYHRDNPRWYAALRAPRNVAPWLWYVGLGLGALVVLTAAGGVLAVILALVNNWFR